MHKNEAWMKSDTSRMCIFNTAFHFHGLQMVKLSYESMARDTRLTEDAVSPKAELIRSN